MKCLGALIGDCVGSIYEFNNCKSKNFSFLPTEYFLTDDSFMTLAVMDYFVSKTRPVSFYLRKWGRKYPSAGYGTRFYNWIFDDKIGAYNSFGNGSAMRISPVGWIANSENEVIELSTRISEVTHNHPDGIKGAQVTAMCIYFARFGKSKAFIKEYAKSFYDLNFSYKDLIDKYSFNETCQGSVPQAIFCFLISKDFEDCLRTAISIGGDSDTIAAIACSIAEAYYKKIPTFLLDLIMGKLNNEQKILLSKFQKIIGD